MNAKTEFLAGLVKSSEVVKSWPSWKQTVWDAGSAEPSLPNKQVEKMPASHPERYPTCFTTLSCKGEEVS
jgi:hypothetical protein